MSMDINGWKLWNILHHLTQNLSPQRAKTNCLSDCGNDLQGYFPFRWFWGNFRFPMDVCQWLFFPLVYLYITISKSPKDLHPGTDGNWDPDFKARTLEVSWLRQGPIVGAIVFAVWKRSAPQETMAPQMGKLQMRKIQNGDNYQNWVHQLSFLLMIYLSPTVSRVIPIKFTFLACKSLYNVVHFHRPHRPRRSLPALSVTRRALAFEKNLQPRFC